MLEEPMVHRMAPWMENWRILSTDSKLDDQLDSSMGCKMD